MDKNQNNLTDQPLQPNSAHPELKTNWPVIAAVAGVLVLGILVLLSIIFLSRSQQPVQDPGQAVDQATITPSVPEFNPSQPQTSMPKYTVVDAEERKAVCNDGTPAVFYFSPGTQEHATDWIIHLHGGGYCGDSESCAKRAQGQPHYTSSAEYKDTFEADGIFSRSRTENPDFADWNFVEIAYCSSDLWSGTADSLVGDDNWHFYGHYIVQAVIEDLKNPEIISTSTLAEASQVIFMGSSAGGVGAAFNLDRVAYMLPEAKVTGLIDGAFIFPVEQPYDAEVAASSIVSPGLADFHGRLFDESCVEATNDADICSSPAGMYPYLEAPVYVFTYQRDPIIIPNITGATKMQQTDQRVYLNNVFLPAYMDALTDIDPVFSANRVNHTAALSDRFFTTKINGVSFAEAFGDWYFGRSETTRYVE